MRIAAAQIESRVGTMERNLQKHLEMMNLAAQEKVDLIVFPKSV